MTGLPESFCPESIDLEPHVLLSCRPFIFLTALRSPWMACDLIDFDFSLSDYLGLPRHFAHDIRIQP